MKLSAPVHVLKSKAKDLKRSKSITMTEALNEVAQAEGFSSWSLLQHKSETIFPKTSNEILNFLNCGDLILISSRPGLGKTTFTLKLLLQAIKQNRNCYFFSLEYTHKDIAAKLASVDENIGQNHPLIKFNFSDQISSKYIIEQIKSNIVTNSIIAIDYLQILDQQRTKPEVQKQVEELKQFAKDKGCIIIFISQMDRTFDLKQTDIPSFEDIRLPNSLDFNLFNKVLFLHNGKKIFIKPAQFEVN